MFGMSMYRMPEFIIDVRDCRAVVSRRVSDPTGDYYVPVANWMDIEEMAIDAVELQGGAVNVSGIYLCPDVLQEMASLKVEG